MKWSLPAPDDRVEWSLWTSAIDPAAAPFKRDFKDVAVSMGKHAWFTPYYVLYDGDQYGCRVDTKHCGNLCTNAGDGSSTTIVLRAIYALLVAHRLGVLLHSECTLYSLPVQLKVVLSIPLHVVEPGACCTKVDCQHCYYCCTTTGRYCNPDPDYDRDSGLSGADVVRETLRQKLASAKLSPPFGAALLLSSVNAHQRSWSKAVIFTALALQPPRVCLQYAIAAIGCRQQSPVDINTACKARAALMHYGGDHAPAADQGIGAKWWAYADAFDSKCTAKDKSRDHETMLRALKSSLVKALQSKLHFTDKACISQALADAKIDEKLVNKCMVDSGGLEGDISNSILDAELTEKSTKSIVVTPTIYVNNVVERGGIFTASVLSTICVGYSSGTEPDVCKCAGQGTSCATGDATGDVVGEHESAAVCFVTTVAVMQNHFACIVRAVVAL
eukprot:13527-Heterococcus_DN1.PRE.4